MTNLDGTPMQRVVKIVFTDAFGKNTGCSGVMVGEYHVWTAAHCLYDKNQGGWSKNFFVYPSQNNRMDASSTAEYPYGGAAVTAMRMYSDWIDDRDLEYDFAVLTLDRRVGRWSGWMGANTNVAEALQYNGYPIEKPFESELRQYNGFDQKNVRDTSSWRITLDALTYGGMSGGPAWHQNGGKAIIQGILSTGQSDISYFTRVRSFMIDDYLGFIRKDDATRPPRDIAELVEETRVTNAEKMLTGSAKPGGSFQIAYNVYNAGTAPADNTIVDFFLGGGGRVNPVGSANLGRVEPGFSVRNTAQLTVPVDLPTGEYTASWRFRTSSPEYDPNNNSASIPVTLKVKSDAKMSVAVTDDFVPTGPQGGPFKPPSKTYVLSNVGATPLNWTVSADQNWLSAKPKSGTLAAGAKVDVTARVETAAANARAVGTYTGTLSFENLSSGIGNAKRPARLVVQPGTFTISLSAQPSGAGSVAGAGTFKNGETRTVTATANTGWIFDKWTDQAGTVLSESASYSFVLAKDTTLRANFVVPVKIDLSASPADFGTVSGGGLFKPGAKLTIRATPKPGFQFEKWTDNGAFVSSKPIYKFTANASRALVAKFRIGADDLAILYSAADESDFGGIMGHMNGQPPEMGGDGTWANLVNWRTKQMAVAQLDDDDYDEIVWLEFGSQGRLYRAQTVPLQTFERNPLNNPRPVIAFTVGDFDGDGRRDDIFARVGGSGAPYMTLINGTWADVTLSSPPLFAQMFSADVDGNGKDDVLGYGPDAVGLGVIHDAGASSRNLYGGTVIAAAAGDLDADGQVDLAFAVSDRVLIQKSGAEILASPTSFGGAKQLHFADADGDGKDELYKLKDDGVWRMKADRTWTRIMQSDSPNSITVLGSVDFDLNGKEDLIVQQTRPGEHFFVLMNNASEFTFYWWGQVNSDAVPIGFAAGVFD